MEPFDFELGGDSSCVTHRGVLVDVDDIATCWKRCAGGTGCQIESVGDDGDLWQLEAGGWTRTHPA